MALTSLAIIGFWPMFFNLLESLWAYSCYLTLREREVWVYLALLLIQILVMIFHSLGLSDNKGPGNDGTFQILGDLIVFCSDGLLGYLVGQAFYTFRKTGGLHGTLEDGATPILFEDMLMDKARSKSV